MLRCQLFVHKAFFRHRLFIKLPADKSHAAFLKYRRAVDHFHMQAACRDFILIPSGYGSHIIQHLTPAVIKKAERELIAFVYKFFGVALRPYKYEVYLLAP